MRVSRAYSQDEINQLLSLVRAYVDDKRSTEKKTPTISQIERAVEESADTLGLPITPHEAGSVARSVHNYYENAKVPPKPHPIEIPMNTMPFFRGISVVGQHFLNDDSKAALKQISPGDIVTLQHEPTNPHDQYAVGVYFGGQRVGYIFKECSPAVAWLLCIKMPLKVQVTEIGGKANNFKVNIIEDKPVTP